jgi:hypothetical protein
MERIDRTSVIGGLAVGLVGGLLLGMLFFWQLFPVRWTDAHSYDLAPEARAEYVGLVADSYKLDRDAMHAAQYLELWSPEEKQQAFADAITMYGAQGRPDKVTAVQDLAMVLGVSESAAPAPEPAPGLLDRLRVPCLVFVLVLLVLVLGWIGFRVASRQRTEVAAATPAGSFAAPLRTRAWDDVGEPALGHFVTTYKLGEDTYDESFSIETDQGEFLGECGVGISETVAPNEPDKVTAFEVWLFDKSDIRTVTKVLMSEHAFRDEALRARLASKGEAVLAQPNMPFLLETSGLELRVDVTELTYGDADEEGGSYFSRLTVELMAMAKPAESEPAAFA